MNARQLRKLGRALIHDLDLDTSATAETVCRRLVEVIAQRTQREILLRFDDLGDTGLSGLWAVTADEVNIIVVTTTRSWVHRLLIVLHEIAHMVCGHKPAELTAHEGRALLFPDLSPKMVKIIAGRTGLSRDEEREADRVAGVLTRALLEWAGRQRIEPFPPDGDDLGTRAWYALGYVPERGRHV
ncbi:hypothetical protein [Amycolatopsis sp. NPDC059021]|uniref:hypothetical protein n=1 Tax=Amycolatopsis sp. NPDC059021 TaxID=3346704 RepID=UPI00366BFBDC